MFTTFKKLFFSLSFNLSLFILLLVGIQNSSNKSKLNLLISETVALPISFVVGSSFILGTILGSVINFSDSMIFAMSVPNIIGLYFLSSELKKDLKILGEQSD